MDVVADTTLTKTRDYRIDALRGIAIILVILHHLQPWSGFRTRAYLWAFYAEVTCLGVPLFYLVSLYLLAQRADRGPSYFLKRVLRLVLLYWSSHRRRRWSTRSSIMRGRTVCSPFSSNGGPGLPVVGPSVFFFLFDLIVLVVVMWAFFQLPARARTIVGVAIVIATAAFFEAASFGAVGRDPSLQSRQLHHLRAAGRLVGVWQGRGRSPLAGADRGLPRTRPPEPCSAQPLRLLAWTSARGRSTDGSPCRSAPWHS